MKTCTTAECETCKFCTLDESNHAKIMVYCSIDDKWRIYGSFLNCEKGEKINDEHRSKYD